MKHLGLAPLLLALLGAGCDSPPPHVERPAAPANDGIHGFASGCFTLDATEPGSTNTRWLEASTDGSRFAFTALDEASGARLHLRAADLGTYLLFDAERHYVVAEDGRLARTSTLLSDVLLNDDTYRSPATWQLDVSPADPSRFRLQHTATGHYLTTAGLSPRAEDAAVVALYPATGCAEFPELTLDAEGTVSSARWEDDDAVYGIVETHGHLFTNLGFGGGGMFHGAPFHPLGVEHALPSCEPFHGRGGRYDLIGFAFSGLDALDIEALLPALLTGRLSQDDHETDGYPTFTDWPSSWGSATHQTQYYRWLERAWMGGLRLYVQHATTNSVLCEFMKGVGAQDTRYSCDDMEAVRRSIEGAYALERYIDAQAGGPGRGFFRIVTSPAEARRVIDEGKLAVLLGIETSNLFECLLTPREGTPTCDAAYVREQLDAFHALGVRALFPVHKFDNAFSPGDGDRNVGQIGSFINSGHWSSFVQEDCPDVDSVFDRGDVLFGGLNMPREDYLAAAPNDMSGFAESPVRVLSPHLDRLQQPRLEGDYCQSGTLTALGETLIQEMMLRGMIVEVDHLPRRAFVRAYEILTEADYPAAGTHGNTYDGRVYELGGVSKTGFGRCADPSTPGALGARFRERIQLIRDHGGYPAEGFGFDLNGFAGGPGPRFGEGSECSAPQSNPVTYPFTSYRGDVTFTQPFLGERPVDFNTEGMAHIGLMPELIEDARRDGMSDDDLAPLFRSAEAYLRMWERAEARAASLRAAAAD